MICEYLHKLCPTAGCENYVCRAYFPEKQPLVMKNMLETCKNGDYEDCLTYVEGKKWRKERRERQLDMHCPFATNNECGKPDHWMCKGRNPPFKLYPVKGEDGELTYTMEQMKQTCLSGDRTVYVECPFFNEGLEQYGKSLEQVFSADSV